MTQLQAMTARIESIDKMLHTLQELSDKCQRNRIKLPRMRNGSNCDHDAIMRLVVDIETQVKMVRNSLLFLCRSYLQERQTSVLLSIQSQMYPTLDISVRFFGIDWLHIFRVTYNLKQCLELMSRTVLQGASTVAFADVLLPRYNRLYIYGQHIEVDQILSCFRFSAMFYGAWPLSRPTYPLTLRLSFMGDCLRLRRKRFT